LFKFVKGLKERMRLAGESFEKEDWEMLQSQAHQLKGAFATFGFPELKEIAGEIEDLSSMIPDDDQQIRISEQIETLSILSERAELAFTDQDGTRNRASAPGAEGHA